MRTGAGERNRLDLRIEKVQDPLLRELFRDMHARFQRESELAQTRHISFVTTKAVSNMKVAHGLGVIPRDLIRASVTGSGVVTFNRSRFDEKTIDVSTTGPMRVRLYVGSAATRADLEEFDDEDTEEWAPDRSEILTGSGAPDDSLGANGDLYVDADSGTIYTKVDGEWVAQGQITGAQGDPGDYVVTDGVPIGTMHLWASDVLPAGSDWTWCAGAAVSRTTYSDLFATIGTRYGIGDGSTTFNLPDYRGYHLRGLDNMGGTAASRDPDKASRTAMVAGTHAITGNVTSGQSTITGLSAADYVNVAAGMTISGTGIPANSIVIGKSGGNTIQIGTTAGVAANATLTNNNVTLTLSKSATAVFIGSIQADAFQGHFHTFAYRRNSDVTITGAAARDFDSASPTASKNTGSPTSDGPNGTPRTASETRPTNAAVAVIIKIQASSAPPASGAGSLSDLRGRVSALEQINADSRLDALEEAIEDSSRVPVVTEYLTPGTYTFDCPLDVEGAVLSLRAGAGGGGSGAVGQNPSGANSGGGGGGAGCVTITRVLTLIPGTSYTVEVGAGGAGGAARVGTNLAGLAGSAGGDSSFSDAGLVVNVTARGGLGGNGGGSSGGGGNPGTAPKNGGGDGGEGGVGAANGAGASADAGEDTHTAVGGSVSANTWDSTSGGGAGGGGGAGDGDGAAGGPTTSAPRNGSNGSNGGGGGGGGAQRLQGTSGAGGNGSDGYVRLMYWTAL